jgi:uncharacterized protein
MYNKLNITENTLRILSLFTYDFDSEYYIREVHQKLKISPRTAQLLLENLENKGILESKLRGKIKNYKLNKNKHTKRYLNLVEQYKNIALLETQPTTKEIINKITPFIKGIGVIFGSFVKGLQKKNSDLDIFVVGTYENKEIKNISKMYGIDISVKCYPLNTFKKNIRKDLFLKEILKNHVVFNNIEQFVKLVVEDE